MAPTPLSLKIPGMSGVTSPPISGDPVGWDVLSRVRAGQKKGGRKVPSSPERGLPPGTVRDDGEITVSRVSPAGNRKVIPFLFRNRTGHRWMGKFTMLGERESTQTRHLRHAASTPLSGPSMAGQLNHLVT